MSHVLSTSVVLALFLLITSVIILFLTSTWTDQSVSTALAINRHLERVESAIDLKSTAQTNSGTCDDYTASVENTEEVLIEDFSDMDTLVEYTNTGSIRVATWLDYSSDWSVTGISPDTRDVNSWNPGETATISLNLSPSAKDGASGTIIVVTSLGISDSAYITCTIS